jgi:TonB family protein
MIPFLNEIGETWFGFVKLLVVQNSLFLGFVFIALYLLKNASAKLKYWITLIGLFKLVLPPFIPSPFIKSMSADVSVQAVTNPIEMLVVFYQSITKGLLLSNTAIFFSFWFMLATIILLVFVFSTFRLKFKLRNSSFLQTLDSGFENSSPKYKIYQSSLIKAPLTIGFFPKKIFVPENWQDWSSECKRMILYHELAHIKRYDGIVQFIQILVQAFYLFHPLVWILNKYMNKYREMACDDLAVQLSNGSSFEYSKYLTEIAEKMVSNRYKFVFASSIFGMKYELLSRIQYQMKEVAMKRISRKKVFWVVAGLLLFIFPLSLTSSQQQKIVKSESVEQEKQKKTSLGKIVSNVLPLPEGGMKTIQKNVIYPDKAKKYGAEGKVFVKAIVDKNGDVTKVGIIESSFAKGKDYGCLQAAIDAVAKAKWSKSSLAKIEESEAGFEFSIPVVFSLGNKNKEVKQIKTGKIYGKITDKETGKALIGVNVVVNGTVKGAATDVKGEYFLVNIREGVYSLKISSVGYKSIMIDEIKVGSGLTKTVDFQLEPAIVKLEDTGKIIKKDVKVKKDDPNEPVFVPYEKLPEPIGGMKAIRDNLKIPDSLKKSGKTVKIFISVLINEHGDVIKTNLGKPNKNDEANKAAIEAIKSVKWKPAKQRNKPVKVWVEVPIEFKVKKS